MARSKPIQNSFNAGEFSKRMFGRTDIAKYQAAAETIENFHILPEGGLQRRSGFRYIADAAATATRLKEFVFSDDQAYILEFSNLLVRFFRDEGVLVQQTLSGIRAADEVSSLSDEITFVGHGYNTSEGPLRITTDTTFPVGLAGAIDYFILLPPSHSFAGSAVGVDTSANELKFTAHDLSDQMGPFQLTSTGALPSGYNFLTDYYVVLSSANQFGLSLSPGGAKVAISTVGTGTHTLIPTDGYKRDKFRLSATAGGVAIDITGPGVGLHTLTPTVSIPITLATPFTTAQLDELQFAQSGDVLYIAHSSHAPRKLSRVSAQGFFLEEVEFMDGPYLNENTTTTTIDPSAATGDGITLTASTALFKGSDVGRLVRLFPEGSSTAKHWGYAKIVAVGANTFDDTDISTGTWITTDVNAGTDTITVTSHGMDTGELVGLKEGGTLPPATPALAEGTSYFVGVVDANNLKFYTTKADAIAGSGAINITGTGADPAHRVTSSVIDIVAHGYSGGEGALQITNQGGAIPSGLSLATDYYVAFVDANSFALSLSKGGAIVRIDEAQGGGTHSLQGASAPSVTCTANVKSDFHADTLSTTAVWRLGSWSGDADIGFPRAISFHEQRLWFAGNAGGPQTIYASKTADFESMSPTGNVTSDKTDLDNTVNADNAIVIAIGTNEINVIRWLSPSRTLLAGTSARVWNIQPASTAGGFEPANTEAQPGGTRGANAIQPVVVENRPVFASQTGLRVSSVGYDLDSDSYIGEDLTLVADHIVRPGVARFAYAPDPWSTVYVARSDGEVAALTILRSQQVAGWARHIMGGAYVAAYDRNFTTADVNTTTDTITDTAHGLKTSSRVRFTAGGTMPAGLEADKDYHVRAVDADTLAFFTSAQDADDDVSRIDLTSTGSGTNTFGLSVSPQVLSVATIPAPSGDPSSVGRANIAHDQLWALVRRTISGTTKLYVEFMEDTFEPADVPDDAFMVDAGISANASATVGPFTAAHLADELVDILADGKVLQAQRLDSSGRITLDVAAAKVHLGLPYASSFFSLRKTVPSQEGTLEATLGRVEHLVLRLDSSLGGEFGHDLNNMTDLSDLLLPHNHLFDTIPPLFSDDIEVPLDAPWETSGRFAVRQSRPLPFSLLAVSSPMQKGSRGNRSR